MTSPIVSGVSSALVVAALRALAALLILVAVVATFFDSASRSTINLFNFFGYFTIQSNLIAAVILALTATVAFLGLRESRGLALARGCAVTYMVIVGLVYNTLLSGLAGGAELPWANSILHVWMPLYLALDWVLVGDRRPLPWNRFWIVLVYPVIWLVVILIRGATDGFVPYPFLDPASGYGMVAAFVISIALAIGLFGAVIWAVSRVAILHPQRADALSVPQRAG